MAQESTPKFDEKILYKTHQHWIVPVIGAIKYIFIFALTFAVVTYCMSDYSWVWTSVIFLLVALVIGAYDYYLWDWLS